LAKKSNKAQDSEIEMEPQISTEQIVQENHLLLHVLIDYLIEKELISKVEFQDRLDLVESELFVEESSCKPKAPKKAKKKK
jgi:hypothetical protein